MGTAFHITIIDDNHSECLLLAEAFREARWDVIIDHCGGDAAAITALEGGLARGRRPDLVMLDYMIHGHASVPLLRRLRSPGTVGQALPVVLMSSTVPLPAVREEYLALGVLDIVVKPDDFRGMVQFSRSLRDRFAGAAGSGE